MDTIDSLVLRRFGELLSLPVVVYRRWKRGQQSIARWPEGIGNRGQAPIAKWPEGCFALLVPDPFSLASGVSFQLVIYGGQDWTDENVGTAAIYLPAGRRGGRTRQRPGGAVLLLKDVI